MRWPARACKSLLPHRLTAECCSFAPLPGPADRGAKNRPKSGFSGRKLCWQLASGSGNIMRRSVACACASISRGAWHFVGRRFFRADGPIVPALCCLPASPDIARLLCCEFSAPPANSAKA